MEKPFVKLTFVYVCVNSLKKPRTPRLVRDSFVKADRQITFFTFVIKTKERTMDYEILAPAGGEQSAYAALCSGANAVYLGLSRFSAREGAENFDFEALRRVVQYAHLLNAKVYVALNTLVKDSETQDFFLSAVEAYNAGADAVLLQDMFLGKLLKDAYPQMELHLSTQAGCCNVYGAMLAKEYGFSRVVLARETPLEEIRKISEIIQTEVFVQGALCSAFSGHCYFSSFAGNNSGNRGRCKQPCRKKYSINRTGYEGEKYALSLSDLCVGERVEELIAAGVYSLKIEGRMRRAEYVAAAVSYYRDLLRGVRDRGALSALKRTYNRGDYTKGLAFGQTKSLLSRDVQGHIGEEVGVISLRKGKYFCESDFSAQEGDGFKILRGKAEVGGGQFLSGEKGGFYLSSSAKLSAGDSVRVTTDGALNARLLSGRTLREVSLSLTFLAGERACVRCGNVTVEGEVLSAAKSAPLREEQLKECFCKTDGLPFHVRFARIQTDGVFLPKSQLNALRREFFARLTGELAPAREPLFPKTFEEEVTLTRGSLTAAIVSDEEEYAADILIVKPRNYSDFSLRGKAKETYLYVPPFLSEEDEKMIAQKLSLFDGVYGEGYYALALAKKYQKALFAGTGFNLTNRFSVAMLKRAGAKYFALSKELSDGEQRALCTDGAFALSAGAIQVMDLLYCPFENTCASCDKRGEYVLTDEGGREFPLRRYRLSGKCRFEVYNCAYLATYNGATSVLADCSLSSCGQEVIDGARSPETIKKRLLNVTNGHGNRSLL